MTGLVGWWPLHEDSGGKAYDLSGNGNHGDHNGTKKGVIGVGGLQSSSFDNAYIDCGSPQNGLDKINDGSFTVSVWIRGKDISSGFICELADGSGHRIFDPRVNSDGTIDSARATDDNSGDYVTTSKSVDDGGWHHFVLRHESQASSQGIMETFIDGSHQNTGQDDDSTSGPANKMTIGARWDGSDQVGRISGANICDLRVYDRALSSQEIQTLYDWGSGDYARPLNNENSSSTVSRYAFDGDATDSWGSNNGTVNGASFVKNSIRGKSASFVSGNQEYISLFEQPDPPFTLSYWVNFGSVSGEQVQVSAYDPRNSDTQGLISRINNGELSVYNGSSNLSLGVSPQTGNWYNIVSVFGSSSTELYLNGSIKNDSNNTVNASNQTIDVGRRFSNSGDTGYLDGKIDDVRIYDKALSPSEVFELYRWGTRGRDLRKLTVNSRGL